MVNRMILNETAYFGKGAIQQIAAEVKKRSFQKGLVVTDKGLVAAGLVEKVTTILDKAELAYEIYDKILPNPTLEVVKQGVEVLSTSGADYILAIGGGSPIDTAKALGIIHTNPEYADIVSLEGEVKTQHPSLPILAVPTTSGTAAEVTINYVITDEKRNRKFVCVDPHDIPVCAFIDSEMMLGMPRALCAATGMDALTHAIEGYITKGAWELTDTLHLKAIEIISKALPHSVEGDLQAREEMALGQYMAGMGFSNVGLGLVHGMAHPLSAWYNVPHGVACASLLPIVMDYNKAYTGEKYRDIAAAMGIKDSRTAPIEEIRDKTVQAVQALGEKVGIPQTISELGAKSEDIEAIANDALQDVCTGGNPRPTNLEEITALYQAML
ncbi:Lactaldehyde reductase [Listeria grayi]|uniref:L-1,2-propanediol oxidoreductase n=1 Tax=Listeria grayi FSL F6-1183 TaxID=1265827 RepID=A0A829R248_LISGR|nr:lactaldehyde reductase [Listeria grayi]EUJ25823.1 L-1,2-propanediol oxidoreductase [Listeria grayi FSL F6-1183]VEI31451.1 Lactaldehyde reductase [Listeria grayi]